MNYPFLAQIDDTFDDGELRRRVRKVLRQMELLSEARAMTIGLGTHGGEPDHLPPETQKLAMRADGKPPRERSLFERYLWEFEQCPKRQDPQWAFRLLCACAERDLEHHLRGPGPSKIAGNLYGTLGEGQSRNGAAVEKEKGDELVRDYEGAPAAEVAQITQQRVEWVMKARELRGRDPETGLPKPEWFSWTPQRRRNEVATRALGQGMTQEQIAGELGVSVRTIRRFWPSERRRRHAA